MSIGQRVRLLRNSLKLSQEEFANPLKVTQEAISAVERTGNASIELLINISNVYSTTLDWLVKGEDTLTKKEDDNRFNIDSKLNEMSSDIRALIVWRDMARDAIGSLVDQIKDLSNQKKQEIKNKINSDKQSEMA